MDSHGTPRTRLGGPLLRSLGIPRRIHRAPVASDPYLHRVTGGNRPHAPRALPHLHFSRIMAVVPGSGVLWNEARRKLARARQILPSIRRRHRRNSARRGRLVRLEPLAKPPPHCLVATTKLSPAATPQSANDRRASAPRPCKRMRPRSTRPPAPLRRSPTRGRRPRRRAQTERSSRWISLRRIESLPKSD